MHYAWHPAYGNDVEVQYREVRRGERVLICRGADGTSAVIPAWMFDAATCAGMAIGPPRPVRAALEEIWVMLRALGSHPVVAVEHERPQEVTDEAEPTVPASPAVDAAAGAALLTLTDLDVREREPGGGHRHARAVAARGGAARPRPGGRP